MGRITTGVGLISGINSQSIIDQLMSLEAAPVTNLQNRITTANSQKSAYTDLQTQLNALKAIGTTLTSPLTFQAAAAASSDENVLTATAANGAAVGSFQFQVAQLVSAQQAITGGFADSNQTKVGAGTITISQGGGELKSQTQLSALNGGAGVRRGVFRITDRSGKSAAIDISSTVTLDDVARKINTSLDISVKASITQQGLVLTDLTGQALNNLSVSDLGDGQAAADLGLVGSVAGNTLTGGDINSIGRATALAQINDGRGIGTASSGADIHIVAGDGSAFDVSLGATKTIGQVLDAINTASAGKITASVVPGSNGIRLTDTSGGGGAITVSALNGSTAAADLRIAGSATGMLDGGAVIGALNSTLIASLRGGTGIPLGQITITDRAGFTATADFTAAVSVQDIIDGINASGAAVKASLNAAGNGIQVTDTSGGTGSLVISDNNSTTAAVLGIAGTFDNTVTGAGGTNLHRQYISANTLLADYNGGKGVVQGKFRVTASTGTQSEIDLSTGNYVTVGDILRTINSRNLGVTASINANGNGILLTDTAGGPTKLKVENTSGTPATDLNILGSATATTIDGAFEKTITVTANDTLASVQTAINNLGFAVTASLVNDGSGATPYRLSLSATNTGRAGRFVFDAGTTGLATRNLVQAQDAAVFLGGTDSAEPLLVTSHTNQLTSIIKGVTVDLHNVSKDPVSLTISRDGTNIADQLKKFTDGFNAINAKITDLTKFDDKTQKRGLLLGESAAQNIQSDLYAMFNSVVKNAGKFKIFADVGVTVTDGAQLTFNSDKFNASFATDPDAVKSLFSQVTTGLGTLIGKQVDKLTDPLNGVIPRQTQTIDSQTKEFQDRITALNDLLQAKRDRLTAQFANMETVLAGLQSQQQALSTLNTSLNLAPVTTSASKSSTSSSA